MVPIENRKISPSSKVINEEDIQIIYIPLESKLGYSYKPVVKANEYVCIGTTLGKSSVTSLPLVSTVNGMVVGFEDKYISNGKLVKCIVIENDFKEKYANKPGKKTNINKYSKEEFLYILEGSGVTDMGGSDYPLYLKYQNKDNLNYLIVDATDYEIYKSSDSALVYNNAEEILEAMDAMADIMGIKKCYIAVNEDNTTIIKKLLKHIGSYPNIKVYPMINAYPSGHAKILVSEILDMDYNPLNKNTRVVVENVATIYAIYEALKYHKPVSDRYVTLAGPGFKNNCNYKFKIGTSLNEVLLKNDILNKLKNPLLIAGGAMTGKAIKSDDLIVTKDLHTILLLENKEEETLPCIKCGKCSEVCPVNLIPSLIIETKNKKYNANRCIECGLCSYVCPAKIDIREMIKKIRGDKDE